MLALQHVLLPRSTSGLRRRPDCQQGSAHRAAGASRGVPGSGCNEAMASRAVLRHPCRICGGICLTCSIPRPPPSKSVVEKSLRTARTHRTEQPAEEVDRLSCSRDAPLTRDLRLPSINTTLETFSAERTTSETICGKAPSQRRHRSSQQKVFAKSLLRSPCFVYFSQHTRLMFPNVCLCFGGARFRGRLGRGPGNLRPLNLKLLRAPGPESAPGQDLNP